nr:helix-turn-helix transcriptional regulator [Cochlodiniinecator piscidefendens]
MISVIDGTEDANAFFCAAAQVIPFTAAFCVVNRVGQPPLYLGDTYPEGAAKQAVQLYVSSTYLLNPVYNAFLAGLKPGVHCMSDLAPDNWNTPAPEALRDTDEEIGYRTPGWPTGLQELSLTVDLPGGAMGEVSFARPTMDGGFDTALADRLRPFHTLFDAAFKRLWGQNQFEVSKPHRSLENFGCDLLTPREAEVVHLILKGHSSLSISLTLNIAVTTVKTHRKNAYAKLGISTQQQLFNAFLIWQKSSVE